MLLETVTDASAQVRLTTQQQRSATCAGGGDDGTADRRQPAGLGHRRADRRRGRRPRRPRRQPRNHREDAASAATPAAGVDGGRGQAVLLPVGADLFAIPIGWVREVVVAPRITPLVTAPRVVLRTVQPARRDRPAARHRVTAGLGSADDVAFALVLQTHIGPVGLSATALPEARVPRRARSGRRSCPAAAGSYQVGQHVASCSTSRRCSTRRHGPPWTGPASSTPTRRSSRSRPDGRPHRRADPRPVRPGSRGPAGAPRPAAARAGADGGDDVLVGSIFRELHTIKGSSAVAGLGEVSSFAHELEELVDDLRAGRSSATPELIDALLAGLDRLSTLIAGATGDSGAEAASTPPEPLAGSGRGGHPKAGAAGRYRSPTSTGADPVAVAAPTTPLQPLSCHRRVPRRPTAVAS